MRKGVLAALFVLGLTSPLRAAFQDSGWGARPAGMGGAFTAIADDSNAALFNPAGMVQLQWNEFSAGYSELFSGLTLYSGPDTVHLNQSYLSFAARPIPHIGSWGVSWASFSATHLYREDTAILTYARNMGDFIQALDNMLAFGVNLKYLRRSVTLDAQTVNDPAFASGDAAHAETLDIGFLFKPDDGPLPGLRVALAGKNLTRPDVGFQAQDRVPMEGVLGLAYQSKQVPWLVPALDLSRRDDVTSVAAGLESWLFNDTLGLRAGVNRDEGSAGLSYYQSLGKRFGLRLDYAFTVPFYVQGTSGSHRLAMTAYF